MATIRALLPIGNKNDPNPKISELRELGFTGGAYDRGDGYTLMNIEVFGEPAIQNMLEELASRDITAWRIR